MTSVCKETNNYRQVITYTKILPDIVVPAVTMEEQEEYRAFINFIIEFRSGRAQFIQSFLTELFRYRTSIYEFFDSWKPVVQLKLSRLQPEVLSTTALTNLKDQTMHVCKMLHDIFPKSRAKGDMRDIEEIAVTLFFHIATQGDYHSEARVVKTINAELNTAFPSIRFYFSSLQQIYTFGLIIHNYIVLYKTLDYQLPQEHDYQRYCNNMRCMSYNTGSHKEFFNPHDLKINGEQGSFIDNTGHGRGSLRFTPRMLDASVKLINLFFLQQ